MAYPDFANMEKNINKYYPSQCKCVSTDRKRILII